MEKRGLAIFSGIVCAKALIFEPVIPENTVYPADQLSDVSEQMDAYGQAIERARRELDDIVTAAAGRGADKGKIFQAHQMLLEDEAINQEIRELIAAGTPVSQAIRTAFDRFIGILSRAENAVTQERAADLKDVRNRILRCLTGQPEKNLSRLSEPCVILAHELLPSDTATIDRNNVRAIVTELGGATSHTAIVARSYAIPTVLGVEGVLSCVADGEDVIVDGTAGLVILRPDAGEKGAYLEKQRLSEARDRITHAYRDRPAVTTDGTRVAIELNISSADLLHPEEIAASDGVGLMRSEFLYMQSKDAPPNEETQFRAYRDAAVAFQGKPVILRTLDIGGDKQLPYLPLPKEDNPFLGKRALRLCLEERALFRTQLRAALRASRYGALWLMFPMVGGMEDFRAAKAVVHAVMEELDAEGIAYNKGIPLGIMIEIPSIALIADQAAREVDFASIGTNDLCQYMMAADRMNPSVAPYYQAFHPGLFRLIGSVAEQFSKYGKPLSVCGEMGGNPSAALALIGLGLRMLSMNAADMAAVKQLIAGVSIEDAEHISVAVRAMGTAAEAERALTEAAAAIVR